jgi:nucleoside-diphosphate kinase
MIKPEQYVNLGKIIQVIEQSGFRITNLRMLKLSGQETQEFFSNTGMQFIGQDVIQFVSSDMVVGMELVRENAISVM